MYVGEFFILGSQESLSALELFEDLCEEHSKKKHGYKCSDTGMHRVYSRDQKGNVPGGSKEGKE